MHVRVYTETESQKQILIGKGGTMVREIGRTARPFVEQLLGHPVYLRAPGQVVPEVAPERDDARAPGAVMAALRREGDELVVKLNDLEKVGALRGDVRVRGRRYGRSGVSIRRFVTCAASGRRARAFPA